MTPKEFAGILFNRFYGVPLYKLSVKACCYIFVDGMIDEYHMQCPPDSYEAERYLYWTKVKEEIDKL